MTATLEAIPNRKVQATPIFDVRHIFAGIENQSFLTRNLYNRDGGVRSHFIYGAVYSLLAQMATSKTFAGAKEVYYLRPSEEMLVTTGWTFEDLRQESAAEELKDRVRNEAAETRTMDAEDDGYHSISVTTEGLACSLAEFIVTSGWGQPIIAALPSGRMAFQWAAPGEMAMMTIGDNGKVRLSSNINGGQEVSTEWDFNEAQPPHVDVDGLIKNHFVK